jgi:hypothetical protein
MHDLGSGTFDISILEIGGSVFRSSTRATPSSAARTRSPHHRLARLRLPEGAQDRSAQGQRAFAAQDAPEGQVQRPASETEINLPFIISTGAMKPCIFRPRSPATSSS